MSSDEIRRQNLKTIERIENDLAPYFFSDSFANDIDKEEIDNYIESNLTVVCIPIFEFLNLSQQPKNIFSIIDNFFTKFHDDPHLLVIKIKDNQVLNYFHLSDFKHFIYQTQKISSIENINK